MSRRRIQPTLPIPTVDGTGGGVPLLLVDGHNLLWVRAAAVAIRDDVPGDYYQLVTDRVVVLNTRLRAGRKLVTPQEVYTRHQVTPAQWADFRALAGDAADEIPGVQGI